MKKIFKFIGILLLLIVIILSCVTFVYRGKINLLINIGKKYISLEQNISSLPKNNAINNMNDIDFKDVVYKNTNNTPLTLDIYKASKKLSKGSPVILYIHGGSWVYGDKKIPSIVSPLLDTFREEGYSIISVEYELMKPKIGFEKPVSDVKDAIRWIYKNKDVYNFNTNEIGVLGISAGAHLGLLASYTGDDEFPGDSKLKAFPSKVKYVVDFIGPTNLNSLDFSKANWDINNILKSISNINEVTSKFSPINYVNKNSPKTLMIYSKNDTLVPYKNALELYDKCKDTGVWVKLVTLENRSHDFSDLSRDNLVTLSKELLKFIVNNSPL